jgi:hypothetical protein
MKAGASSAGENRSEFYFYYTPLAKKNPAFILTLKRGIL